MSTKPSVSRILVVDDDLEVADILREVLEEEGHQVFVAHDGASAVTLALTPRPEIAFLDFGLPDMDGVELAGRLRSDPATAGIRLIALTGSEESARASAAGFERFLLKPVSLEALLLALVPQSGR